MSGRTNYKGNNCVPLRRLTLIIDGRGVVTNLTHDNAGRLLSK